MAVLETAIMSDVIVVAIGCEVVRLVWYVLKYAKARGVGGVCPPLKI